MDPFAGLWVVLFLLSALWLIWMVLFFAHNPDEELRQTKRHRFLGPGGPDDPFADDPFDD
jgi:hypothetical protein